MSNQEHINSHTAIWIYILVSLFLCFEMAIQVSPSIMTAKLMHDFNIDTFGLGLLSGVYYYTYTIMQIPVGLIFDRFSAKKVIVVAIIACSFGTYLFSKSDTLVAAITARLLMGFGSAFAFVAVLIVANKVFPKKYFALMTGITQMLAAFGAIGGQMPLSYLVAKLDWRNTLLLLAITGLLLCVLIIKFINFDKQPNRIANKGNHNSIIEDFKNVFLKLQTWIIASYACLLWVPMVTFASLWGVSYIEIAYQLSAHQAALLTSLMWVGIALGSPLLGWWSDQIQSRTIPLFICSLIGLVCSFELLNFTAINIFILAITILLVGFACSGQALSFAVIKDIWKEKSVATALGFNNMAVVIAGAIFQPVVGKLIQVHSKSHIQIADYQFGLSVLIYGFILAAFLSSFFIKETLVHSVKSLVLSLLSLNKVSKKYS